MTVSSQNAEINAQVVGMAEGFGVTSFCEEWHQSSELTCFCDSSVAQGISSCVGVGKMKDIEVRQQWNQEKILEGRTTVSWIFPLSELGRCPDHCALHHTDEGALFQVGVEVRSELARSA